MMPDKGEIAMMTPEEQTAIIMKARAETPPTMCEAVK